MREMFPFLAIGLTTKIAADTTAPSGVQCTGDTKANPGQMYLQYRLQNNGTETIFYAYGQTAAAALANAVIPTGAAGNAKGSIPLGPGAIEVVSAPLGSFWSGITLTAAQSLFVTPGNGL